MSSHGEALQGYRQKTRGRRGIRGNSAKKNKSTTTRIVRRGEALIRARRGELVERTSVPRVFSRLSWPGFVFFSYTDCRAEARPTETMRPPHDGPRSRGRCTCDRRLPCP